VGHEAVTFQASDGVSLEGRLAVPDSPAGGAIICHAHPQYGGSMSNAIVPAIWRALEARGWVALRFNFRGVGRSEGSFTNGQGETLDARAALNHVASVVPEGAPLAVAGWSFGSLVGLRAAVGDGRVAAYAGVAPPVRMSVSIELPSIPSADELATWGARALFVCGTEDPFCSQHALERWIAQNKMTAAIDVLDGQDHFFSTAVGSLAAVVADFITS
jgi:alpha/beta superfamily hydrolase